MHRLQLRRRRKACLDYLVKRPEIDPDRLGDHGLQHGLLLGAARGRRRAPLQGLRSQRGHGTRPVRIFNLPSPTFKLNYMYMAGYDDEAAFDEFAKTLTLKDVAPKIRCPYIIVAGEDDDLCDIEFVYQFMNEIPGPRLLVVYEGEKHSIRNPRPARCSSIGSPTGCRQTVQGGKNLRRDERQGSRIGNGE